MNIWSRIAIGVLIVYIVLISLFLYLTNSQSYISADTNPGASNYGCKQEIIGRIKLTHSAPGTEIIVGLKTKNQVIDTDFPDKDMFFYLSDVTTPSDGQKWEIIISEFKNNEKLEYGAGIIEGLKCNEEHYVDLEI